MVEVNGGTETLKCGSYLWDNGVFGQGMGAASNGRFDSAVGLMFNPGSEIALRNASSSSSVLYYHITGYLVDAP